MKFFLQVYFDFFKNKNKNQILLYWFLTFYVFNDFFIKKIILGSNQWIGKWFFSVDLYAHAQLKKKSDFLGWFSIFRNCIVIFYKKIILAQIIKLNNEIIFVGWYGYMELTEKISDFSERKSFLIIF